MKLYYNIVKNVYKTYTKHINSVYKFLIGLQKLLKIVCSINLIYKEYYLSFNKTFEIIY